MQRCRIAAAIAGSTSASRWARSWPDLPLPLKTWLYAIYLDLTSLKGVSSMKLHRDLGVGQPTAWFMRQRIREAFADIGPKIFEGPVEVDETYVGGLERNKHAGKKIRQGRGTVGKAPIAGIKDRATGTVAAEVVDNTTATRWEGSWRGTRGTVRRSTSPGFNPHPTLSRVPHRDRAVTPVEPVVVSILTRR